MHEHLEYETTYHCTVPKSGIRVVLYGSHWGPWNLQSLCGAARLCAVFVEGKWDVRTVESCQVVIAVLGYLVLGRLILLD